MMCLAEGHAKFAHQPVGQIGSGGKTARRHLAHARCVKRHIGNHAGHRGDGQSQQVICLKHRRFIVLHIFGICERQTLHRDHQAVHAANDPACMATHQFRRIGIALLRHDGAACRPCVGQADETIRLRRPYDHFFGQPRQMKRRLCGGRKELKREVAVGNRVQTVRHGAVKAKRQCRCGAINREGCSRKSGCAQGRLV